MSTFREFWEAAKGGDSIVAVRPKASEITGAIVPIVKSVIQLDSAGKKSQKLALTALGASGGSVVSRARESKAFSSEVAELAVSSEVVSELSSELGRPEKDETEDEFVRRGKDILAGILMRKLSGK